MNLLKHYFLVWAELGAMLLAFASVWLAPGLLDFVLRPLWKIAVRNASNRKAAWAVAFSLPLALRLLVWPMTKIPVPNVQDEFSFLLMADTFASGRITNPTHPMWVHFETMHVLQHPTYASMYPVMQGLFLALGQVIGHAPWLGVWLSVILMCGSFYWALRAWMPPVWALGGAALAAIRIAMFSYWMSSYWGGAPAAIGGALVLGALHRVFQFKRTTDSLWLAAGILILANSRPYEGFFYCLPVAVLLFAWLFGADDFCRWFGLKPRGKTDLPRILMRVVAPMALVLVLGGVAMMYYFWRVTGNPVKMPYQVWAEQYSVTPLFVWQKFRPLHRYNNEVLRYFFTQWNTVRASEPRRLVWYWLFYVGPVLTLPLALAWTAWRDRKMRFFLALFGFVLLAVSIEWWAYPHYAAPAVAALYALILQNLRHLRAGLYRRGARSRWRGLVPLVPAVIVVMIAVRFATPAFSLAIPGWLLTWAGGPQKPGRSKVEAVLNNKEGKHLVLVRYVDHYDRASINDEWVYNRDDIDASKIVWARELDPEQNRKLIKYFHDRDIWLYLWKEHTLIPLSTDGGIGTDIEANPP